jgi:hypothetical protein
MKYIKTVIVLLFAFAQSHAQDTATMLKDFNKVMAFGSQPYLHYTAVTKMASSPIMQLQDTMSTSMIFYKNLSNYYSSNQHEELYMEDSFYIEINHDRKSIWISTINEDLKKKMDKLPMDNKEWQKIFKKDFQISQTSINKTSSKLGFKTIQVLDSLSNIVINIGLQYVSKSYMPELMEMEVNAKQVLSAENLQGLKDNGTNTEGLVQAIGENNFMVRKQKLTMVFSNLDNSKEKAMQIPTWKSKLDYDITTKVFTKKEGTYADYELTKTF